MNCFDSWLAGRTPLNFAYLTSLSAPSFLPWSVSLYVKLFFSNDSFGRTLLAKVQNFICRETQRLGFTEITGKEGHLPTSKVPIVQVTLGCQLPSPSERE